MAEHRNIVINATSVNQVLKNHEAVSQEKVQEATSDPVEQARLVAGLNNALIEILDHEETPDVLSSPPSQLASQLQTFLAQKAMEEDKPIARELPGGAVEAKFDSKDWIGWAKSFFTWVGRLDYARWLTAPSNPQSLPENARIALLADWGTGLYGAPASAKCITATTPAFTHVIHLGDVYYSGTEAEIDERFIAFWPSVSGAISRACNSNHEMYSGGHGYFEKTLPLFGQLASYFAYENKDWLLVGLDSAYEEHSLTKEQLGWLSLILQDPSRAAKKLVLLSHHQPYSLLDNQGPKLISFLRLLLDTRRIYAWYWGHEHRCVVYDRHPNWNLAGRCIGHGGYPYFRDTNALRRRNAAGHTGANGSTWFQLQGTHLTADQSRVPGGLIIPSGAVLDGSNPYLEDDAEKYGPHGYVALEFQGNQLFETFYTPCEPGPKPLEIIARRAV
jgi:calcineurin-like phosphoesterase family protein